MPRQPRKVDPRRTYVVADGHTPLTPAFYHPELARTCLRELSKDRDDLELAERPAAEGDDASFNTAVDVLSKEQRWLTMARSDKKQFTALCEGWASAPVSERLQEISQ
jgi:hypothetical protein